MRTKCVAEEDVVKVLKEVRVEANPAQLHALMEAMKGKKLHELIAAGLGKIQSVAVAGKPTFNLLSTSRRGGRGRRGRGEAWKEEGQG